MFVQNYRSWPSKVLRCTSLTNGHFLNFHFKTVLLTEEDGIKLIREKYTLTEIVISFLNQSGYENLREGRLL